jgi:uncharacterized membrane protein (UPF0127 family)
VSAAAAAACPRLDSLPARELDAGLRVHEARTTRVRMLGLAFLDSLPYDRALRFERCSSVHTFGMRFPLDLVWLDRDEKVVRVDREVPRRRLKACRGARTVVECGAGQADMFLAAGLCS